MAACAPFGFTRRTWVSAALPKHRIAAVTVTTTEAFRSTTPTAHYYRGRAITQHATKVYRVEIVADDSAVEEISAGIEFARSAGLLGTAIAWVSGEATDLFTESAVATARSA